MAAYAATLASDQQSVITRYRDAVDQDRALHAALARQRAVVLATSRRLSADRAAAATQQAALRRVLSGVKGELAVAVTQAQDQQMAVQEAEEKAILANAHQLPQKLTPAKM